MPRGKLHYECYEEDGMLIEHWLDPHGCEHENVTPCVEDSDYDFREPEGCAACGGDYPNCMDSCPLFDD